MIIAGVDEVGRGPLAGAVVAAAVILDPNQPIVGLKDSKQLSEKNTCVGIFQSKDCIGFTPFELFLSSEIVYKFAYNP